MRRWIALAFLVIALGGCKDLRTRLPLLAGVTVGSTITTSPVAVEFSVANVAGTSDAVNVRYSSDGRRTWQLATPATGSNPVVVAGTPNRTTVVFSWDAVADLGPGLHNDLAIRIDSGRSLAESAGFVLDATDWLEPVGGTALTLGEAFAAPFPDGSVWVAGSTAGGTLSASGYRYDPSDDTVSAAGALSVARAQARGARLAGGGLLVVGGTLAGNAVGTLDLATLTPGGTVTVVTGTATLATPRALPAVAGLTDGRAVIVGGETGAGPATTLELFAPAATGGTLAAGLTDAALGVVGATATTLADGRVLIAGGDTGAGVTGSLVFLAADGGSLAVAGVAITPRAEHRAVLLPDGRVAFLGGTSLLGDDGSALATVELFDPVAGTLALLDPMSEPRRRPGVAYVNGALLAVGGSGSANAPTTAERLDLGSLVLAWAPIAEPSGTARGEAVAVAFGAGQALVVGGEQQAERYVPDADIVAEAFESIASPTAPRADHTATRLADGKVLVAGGTDGVNPVLASAELFDPADRTFAPADSLARARRGHAAAASWDGVLVAGGVDASGVPIAVAERYDRPTDTWSDSGSLNVPRSGARAVSMTWGQVLIVGGVDASGVAVDEVEEWDPNTGDFTVVATLSGARAEADAVVHAGRVLVGPGTDAGGATDVLDVITEGSWSVATDTLAAARSRAGLTVVAIGDLAAISGGEDAGGLLDTVELVDLRPTTPALLAGQITLTGPRARHRAVPYGQAVVAIGGVGPAGLALDTADVIRVDAAYAAALYPRSVTPVGTAAATNDPHANVARVRHTATALGDGRVLIVGGVDHRGVAIAGGEVYR